MILEIDWAVFFSKHLSSIIAGIGLFLVLIAVILNFFQSNSYKKTKIALLITIIIGVILLIIGIATNKKWAEILSYLGVIISIYGFISLITNCFKTKLEKSKIIISAIIFFLGLFSLIFGLIYFGKYFIVLRAFAILMLIAALISLIIIYDERKETSRLKTKDISIVGILGALGVISMLIGIPIMPVAGFDFLKLNFCLVVLVCTLLLFDFRTAVAVAFVSNFIDGLLKPGIIFLLDQGINFVASILFLIPIYFLVSYTKKRITSEIPHKNTLTILFCAISTLSTTVLMIFINYFIVIPIYDKAYSGFISDALLKIHSNKFLATIMIFGTFNIIKWTCVSIVISLIYNKFIKFKKSISYEELLAEELEKSIL